MYVRWNRRKRKPGRGRKEGDYLTAVLVKSVRIDGKPRQKVIKSLGSIGEGTLKDKLHYAIRIYSFWGKVKRNLLSLGLSDDEKEKVIASLEKTVPTVSDEEIKQQFGEEGYQNIRKVQDRKVR